MSKRVSYERKADQPLAITPVEYGGLQAAYDHFNTVLFDGALPDCFITYQRHAHSRGFFSLDRFAGRSSELGRSELALNPDAFIDRSDEQICSTLVHEMTHGWQYAFGKPSKRGYHNKEWAAKMEAIGLMPSNSGAVGGKRTGQQMSHYILPGGRFASAFAKLATTGWRLNLQSAPTRGPNKGPNSKTKFTCTGCGQNAWGKPDLSIACIPCGGRMLPDVAKSSAPIAEAA